MSCKMKNFHDLSPMPIHFEDNIPQTDDSIMRSLWKQSVLCSIMRSIHVLSMIQSCIFLHAKMIETCALHLERFITDIYLLEVFQIYWCMKRTKTVWLCNHNLRKLPTLLTMSMYMFYSKCPILAIQNPKRRYNLKHCTLLLLHCDI